MPHDTKAANPSENATIQETAAEATPVVGAHRISSADLFAGAREIEIEHNGRRYQLRITQTGKLILTA